MTAANGYSLLELADCASATQRRIIDISNASKSCLVMSLTLAAHRCRLTTRYGSDSGAITVMESSNDYCMVALTVATDVPELVGLLPVA